MNERMGCALLPLKFNKDPTVSSSLISLVTSIPYKILYI